MAAQQSGGGSFLNSPDCRAVFGVNAEAAEFNQFEQPFVNQSR
jgi:hypothetical protein